MGTHRAALIPRTPRRRLSVGIATAALSITGIGLIAANAQAGTPQQPFPKERFNQLMDLPLEDFTAEAKKHDPKDKTPDQDGIRWDSDGCSVPEPLAQHLKGGPAEDACVRHDVAYRSLQQNGLWNAKSKGDADWKLEDDLQKLNADGKVPEYQEILIALGAGVGSSLPSAVNGLPAYDGSADSPYTQSDPNNHRSGRSLDDQDTGVQPGERGSAPKSDKPSKCPWSKRPSDGTQTDEPDNGDQGTNVTPDQDATEIPAGGSSDPAEDAG
ncbi:phospholipase A2 [Streptomyces sp. NPDC050636]|uniref:phospholipase A2 n=1 Tax=Streptomyces sp. NPDC050636 TaxID=3154510 RepID=UPI003416435F